MALLESCCCCTLAISSAVLGVYLLVGYIIAFTIELWWILEATAPLPTPAYLLCSGYFVLFIFSALLLHGLSVKRATFLLVWMFMMGILLGPEAGLVLYMSIHHWRITSLYGLIEVTCWACRLLVNITGIICVQSLYSIWREEKSVLLRLQALKMSPAPQFYQNRIRRPSVTAPCQGHQNPGFQLSETKSEVPLEKQGIDIQDTVYSPNCGIFKNEDYDSNFFDPFFVPKNENFSEFNASSFDPTIIDARLRAMPYLTIRNKPKELDKIIEESETDISNTNLMPKTRSLIDFSGTETDSAPDSGKDFNNTETVKNSPKDKAISLNYINCLEKQDKKMENSDSFTRSLDRKIIKNKNLKILWKLSPFFGKKSIEEINVYQINPPKSQILTEGAQLNVTDIDSQLNRVFSNRGMYSFDEKTKKVIFYPPEFFNKTGEMKKFHNRMDSYGSSPSRSSIDNDSEDLRQISDVAL